MAFRLKKVFGRHDFRPSYSVKGGGGLSVSGRSSEAGEVPGRGAAVCARRRRQSPQSARVGSADQRFPEEIWKSADPEGFNLWPSGSSIECAAAGGCRLGLPGMSFPGIPENRRNQPLQSMAADFVCYPAAAGACRLSLPAASGSRPCRPAAPAINPQGILRIRRIRELQFMVPEFVARTGGSKWQSALPTLEKLKRVGLPWGQRCAIILE